MVENDFGNAMRQAGIDPPPDIAADGILYRFHVIGDTPRTKKGWYYLHADPPNGEFGRWQGTDPNAHKWSGKAYQALTSEEKARYKANMEATRAEREREIKRRHAAARDKAARIWKGSRPALDHPYLARKGVKSHILRESSRGSLVVPLRDCGGTLHGLQFIGSDGSKYFLTGTAKEGNYFAIGTPDGILCLAEGYATGASVHECTGHAVAVAFDAGNLAPVAQALRGKFPALEIIVCGDNDPSGTGQKAATKAALAVNGLIAFPSEVKDFNDLHQLRGADAVKASIGGAI